MTEFATVRGMEEVLAFVGSFFMKKSPVHKTAEQIARALRELNADFAICGALVLGVPAGAAAP